MTFSAKVLADLTGVAQGYKDHIALCQSIIDEGGGKVTEDGRQEMMADGLTAADSLAAHLGYVAELAGLIGVPQPVIENTVTAEGLEAVAKLDGAD